MSTIKLENGQEIHIEEDKTETSYVPVVDTQYYASPWSRFFAFFIDSLLQLVAILLLYTLLPALSREPDLFFYPMLIAAICTVFYLPISFFFFKNTIGGNIIKINILNTSKESPSRWKLLFRGILIGFPLGFGVLTTFFDKKKRAVHDMIFGTVVTKDRIY